MENHEVIRILSEPFAIKLVPTGVDKDVRHRLVQYEKWFADNGLTWHTPNLSVYRDYLPGRGLVAASVQAYLATIRGRYMALLRDNAIRDRLFAATPQDASAADREATRSDWVKAW